MNRLGHELLPGSARALDEDRGVARRDTGQEREDLTHLTRGADQSIKRGLSSELNLHPLALKSEAKSYLTEQDLVSGSQEPVSNAHTGDTNAVLGSQIRDTIPVQLKLKARVEPTHGRVIEHEIALR